jgi:cadmium resistance protein CadD (predicted permease)
MISLLVTLLVFVLIAGVLCFVARTLLRAFKIPEPWASVAYAIVCLILLVLFLSEIGWVSEPHAWRHFR